MLRFEQECSPWWVGNEKISSRARFRRFWAISVRFMFQFWLLIANQLIQADSEKSRLTSFNRRRNDFFDVFWTIFNRESIRTSTGCESSQRSRAISSFWLEKLFDQHFDFLYWSGKSTRSGVHPNKFIHGRKRKFWPFSKYLLCSTNSQRLQR